MKPINILILVVLFLSCSCKKNNQQNNPNTKAIGHGGMGISNTIPINTFESINKCLFSGADGVEFDIQLTEDSVWVVFHEEKLSPATNKNGSVFDNNWEDIKDAYYMNPIFANYALINVNQLLDNIPNKEEFVFSIDLKNYKPNAKADYSRKLADHYVKLIQRHNILSNSYLSTSNLTVLDKINAIDSSLNLFIYSGSNFEEALQHAINKNYDGITIHLESLNKNLVERAHSFGIKIATFGVNSNKNNSIAIDYAVDYIETDLLYQLLDLLH